MKKILKCNFSHSPITYEIEIQNGLLKDKSTLPVLVKSLGSKVAIITDDSVASLYGDKLLNSLTENGLETYLFSFPAGEQSKSRQTKDSIEDRMFAKKLGRDTCVIAIGGGVSTDLGGYVAATYCRGVPLIMIPTSLLGMVDASIGGKTGINVPHGKNLLGCIYQPQKILIDPDTLQSLPVKELRNGVVEMIKHGLIVDKKYFELLENHSEQLQILDSEVLVKTIYGSCQIKNSIVEQDEHENGKRRLLNFGHTVGHALEKLSNYLLPHGEAVALGMLVESRIALRLGYFQQTAVDRIHAILKKYSIPTRISKNHSIQSILDAMILDKKSSKGFPRFVILNGIGSALSFDGAYCTPVDENILKNALEECLF